MKKSIDSNRRLPYSRYVQLATVRPGGRPANRTIVFRGFLDSDPLALTFITDKRSKKIPDLAANPWGEVAWYFPQSREQYRISGKLTVVQDDSADEALLKARQTMWSKLSPAARVQFSWPEPGASREGLGSDDDVFNKPDPGPESPALSAFCLLVLHPDEVGILQLKQNRRMHYMHEEGKGWSECMEVNP